MISVLSGNLFESKAQTWVNTVNCVGVMGKGVALGFKERFPEMFADYQRRCERGEVRLGRPYLFKPLVGPWIVNFPTKQHWRQVTNLQDIISGLEYLRAHYKDWRKNFDGTGSFGPWLVTPDAVPPGARGLRIQGRLNGRVMQDSRTDLLIFSVATLIETISVAMSLERGDVIITGTPGGVGAARKPPVFMKAGDIFEVDIEGLGVLTNPVQDD